MNGPDLKKVSSDTAFYIEQVASEQCWCGKPKKSGFAFCYRCHKVIGERDFFLQRSLNQRAWTEEFRKAFDECVRLLEEEDIV